MQPRSVSLVLPMFNEKVYLEKAVTAAVSVLAPLFNDFEIIIVDDASTDGSHEAADRLASCDSRIKVIHHKNNRKLGGVLKTGFSAASKAIVVYTDMDMPFDFSLLGDFIKLTDDADIVNGCRIAPERSFRRRVYSTVYNFLIRMVFGLKIDDVNFSMKVFKKSVLGALGLKSEGSFISAEILVKAQYLGYKITEVPVNYCPRLWGRSRLSSPAVILKILYEMMWSLPGLFILRVRMSFVRARARLHNFVRRISCPFGSIAGYIPQQGDVYDLGCGYGTLLGFLPPFTRDGRQFTGFDIDPLKINLARIMHKKSNAVFEVKDASEDLGIRAAGCIILADTLMFMPPPEQEKLLIRCLGYLSPAGTLLIKEVDTQPPWKFFWHQLQETVVLKALGLIKGKGIYCRPRREYISLLEKTGYRVKAVDIQKGYPYPHVLYVCSRS